MTACGSACVTGKLPEFLKSLKALDSRRNDVSYSGQLIAATDNSVYQQLSGSFIPQKQSDLVLVMKLAGQDDSDIQFSPQAVVLAPMVSH